MVKHGAHVHQGDCIVHSEDSFEIFVTEDEPKAFALHPALLGSRRTRLRAMWRTTSIFCGPWPVGTRLASP